MAAAVGRPAVLLGVGSAAWAGEPLLAGIDAASLGYKCTEHASSDQATRVVLTKQP